MLTANVANIRGPAIRLNPQQLFEIVFLAFRLEFLWSPVAALNVVNGLFPIGTAVIVILQWSVAKRIAVLNFILA
jgi:hypothetical protein